MNDLQQRATSGEELRVDYASIEHTLSELWRVEESGEHAVTRAALWNVIALASTPREHTRASEVLGRAATAVPQRSIVVRADPSGTPELTSWISANCHLLGEGKQVCSEEIAIVAGGDHVARVAPLVNALLIPDMPVAVWWLGDLPHENPAYLDALLEPADRLIVDSVYFGEPADLALLERIAASSASAPADLNWVRSEEWRAATASLFDPLPMRGRVAAVRRIRVLADATDPRPFGHSLEAVLFAAWLMTQCRLTPAAVETEIEVRQGERDGLARVEIEMDGSTAVVERDLARCVITTSLDGRLETPESVTRTETRRLDELIVRELKQPRSDRLLRKVLPLAKELAQRLRR